MSATVEVEWVERTETHTRVTMWRTRLGYHYEAEVPRDGSDVAEMYQMTSSIDGTVVGAHPELGDVTHSDGGLITTRLYTTGETGPWIKTGH